MSAHARAPAQIVGGAEAVRFFAQLTWKDHGITEVLWHAATVEPADGGEKKPVDDEYTRQRKLRPVAPTRVQVKLVETVRIDEQSKSRMDHSWFPSHAGVMSAIENHFQLDDWSPWMLTALQQMLKHTWETRSAKSLVPMRWREASSKPVAAWSIARVAERRSRMDGEGTWVRGACGGVSLCVCESLCASARVSCVRGCVPACVCQRVRKTCMCVCREVSMSLPLYLLFLFLFVCVLWPSIQRF